MNRTNRTFSTIIAAAVCLSLLIPAAAARAGSGENLRKDGKVYVSIYSNVFAGPKKNPFQLASMVVVRNTDPAHSLNLLAADYYDSDGKKVRSYVGKPLEVGPLSTVHYFVEERDTSGGAGANFIVRWEASREINIPIIEGVMTGGRSGQGISFITPGQYIAETD